MSKAPSRQAGHSKSHPAFFSISAILGILLASILAVYLGLRLPWFPSAHAICSEGKIYTVDPINSRVDCLVIKDGRIVHVGTDIKRLPNLHILHIPKNAVVLPGLSDSHGHLLEYGASRELPLEGTATIDETVSRVRHYILNNPAILNNRDAVIRGGGWDHTRWPGAAWPTAAHLEADPIIKGRLVVLQSKDCHALWVLERAMAMSAMSPSPVSVEGGVVLTDAAGAPTGAAQAASAYWDDLVQRFTIAVNDALAYGLTSVHDAGLDPASLAFFTRQADKGDIPIRIYGMKFFDETEPYWGNTTRPFVGAANGRLTARSVKIFADGALRTGGSALYEPYADNPSTSGFMLLEESVLFDFIPRFLLDGWQVNVHAIGERANGIVLDAFEASLKGVNVTALLRNITIWRYGFGRQTGFIL
ncbi:amidohydrolase family-domain-containing protein [Mycena pura]|uniref:Amidohydrolase family-domain-containing protein n=1 Tax=Mycena pura TaxID=153505 RepID=A0AAD6URT9_9AGAR|nr:amidohydrolase family-domain-containing protein [Mycena pura]